MDCYPLVNPWGFMPSDVNLDGKVDLCDVVLAATAYGSTPGDPNWTPVADLAPPYGKVNLYDLVTILSNYGKQYP